MSGIERQLQRLEDSVWPEPEDERDELKRGIQETTELINHCTEGEPLFEITAEGDVLCAHAGKPVTSWHQTGAEQFCWMEVGWGGSGFIYDEEGEAYYTPEGELAHSQPRFDLRHLLGRGRR
jgi:hypothetical protein